MGNSSPRSTVSSPPPASTARVISSRVYHGDKECISADDLFGSSWPPPPAGCEGASAPPQHERGVALPVMSLFSRKYSSDVLTTDVMKDVVRITTEHRCTLYDLLHDVEVVLVVERKEAAAAGAAATTEELRLPALSRPNRFLSHTWRSPFEATIAAAEAVFGQESFTEMYYVWMDAFCLNQHTEIPGAPGVTDDQLAAAFKASVKSSGHTLIVCSPWSQPASLRRCWCLYEVLTTMTQGAAFAVAMTTKERAAFGAALRQNFREVERKCVADIDGRNAEAHSEDDRQMIFGWIQKAGGFGKLNFEVKSALRRWIIKGGLALLRQMDDELGTEHRTTLKFLNELGNVLHVSEEWTEAERLHRRDVAASRKKDGNAPTPGAETLTSMNNLALSLASASERGYGSRSKIRESEKLLRKVYADRADLLGEDHDRTVWARQNLGWALFVQRRFCGGISSAATKAKLAESEALFRGCLNHREESCGKVHWQTLNIIHSLGRVIYAQAEAASAAEGPLATLAAHLARVRSGNRSATFVQRHTVRKAAASAKAKARWAAQSDLLEEAEAFQRRCAAGRAEVLGVRHRDTCWSRMSLGKTLLALQLIKSQEEAGKAGWKAAAGASDEPETLRELRFAKDGLCEDVGPDNETVVEATALISVAEMVYGVFDAEAAVTSAKTDE